MMKEGFARRYAEAAFTMVEVVLAMGVVSLALVSILGMFVGAMRSAQDSENETRTGQLAQAVMADLLSSGELRHPAVSGGIINASTLLPAASASTSNVVYYTRENQGCAAADQKAFYRLVLVVRNNGQTTPFYTASATVFWPQGSNVFFSSFLKP
jgi:type II secretory pathway pseudopilin PulG